MKLKNRIDHNFALFFLIVPLTWAGSFIAGKYVVTEINPTAAVFWRFLFSAITMFPLLIIFRRGSHPNLRDKDYLIHLLVVALTSGVLYHLFFFWALRITSPTNAALIISLNPFFTAFAEIYIFKTKRPNRFYLGFGLSFLGAIWVTISRGGGVSLPGKGELFCLAASVLWSFYTIYARKTKRPEWDSMWIGAYNYLLTALILLPIAYEVIAEHNLLQVSASVWYGLVYLTIFPTVLGYTLFYIGVQKRGPAWAATYIYLVPSITGNLDHFFFDARLTIPMVFGTTIVVIGLIFGNITRKQYLFLWHWLSKALLFLHLKK